MGREDSSGTSSASPRVGFGRARVDAQPRSGLPGGEYLDAVRLQVAPFRGAAGLALWVGGVIVVVAWRRSAGLLSLTGGLIADGAFVAIIVLSVLAHEIGHGAILVRGGHSVRVRFSPLLGVCQPTGDREIEPNHMLLSILAGPVVNLALAAGLWATKGIASGPLSPEATSVLQLAAQVNLALGVLNLAPVWPLDGAAILANLLDRLGDSPMRLVGHLVLGTGGAVAAAMMAVSSARRGAGVQMLATLTWSVLALLALSAVGVRWRELHQRAVSRALTTDSTIAVAGVIAGAALGYAAATGCLIPILG